MTIDADQIHNDLWQGSAPPTGTHVKDAGFTALVLCADGYQPPASEFPGVQVIHAPNTDDPTVPPRRADLNRALQAAGQAAEILEQGGKVLVTCRMGINRSSLVTALTLHKLTGMSGLEACERIMSKRLALTNPQFLKCLSRIPARLDLEGNPTISRVVSTRP